MDFLINEDVLLLLLSQIPLLASAIIAYYVALSFSVGTLKRSGKFLKSYIIAISVFLIANFLIKILLLLVFTLLIPAIGLIFTVGSLGLGLYVLWLQLLVLTIVTVVLFFKLNHYKRDNNIITQEFNEPKIFRFAPVIMLLGILILISPIVSTYKNVQSVNESQEKGDNIAAKINIMQENLLSDVTRALAAYNSENGVYPNTIVDLQPDYLSEISKRARIDVYNPLSNYSSYRLCASFNREQKCIEPDSDWYVANSYCSGYDSDAVDCIDFRPLFD